ncbi:MAG: DUF2167 domain-containing protein [Gemmatimonadales bacterium]
MNTRTTAGALLAALMLVSVAAAPAVPALAAQEPEIPWTPGPTTGRLGDEAAINVPSSCLFTGTNGVELFMEMTENPVGGNERGVVLCPIREDAWFVVFSFEESGYVRDDEGGSLDAEDILSTIRRSTNEANKERRRRGWGSLTIEDWVTAPHYDSATNNLTWALTARTDSGERSVNHSVRLLGRTGVMHVDLVSSPELLDQLIPTFNTMLAGFEYQSGYRYAEWREGDKVAAYGLTALVAGGAGAVLAKSGLLARFWKLIVAGVLALLAAMKGLWRKVAGGSSSA